MTEPVLLNCRSSSIAQYRSILKELNPTNDWDNCITGGLLANFAGFKQIFKKTTLDITKNTLTSSPMPIVSPHSVTLFLGQHRAPDSG